MKLFSHLSAFSRRAIVWLAWLMGAVALSFVVFAATMYFWLLPNIAEHRDTLANMMSRAFGQRVTLEAVSGSWQQARPQFRLRGLRVYDKQQRPALYLEALEASFSWRSLLVLQPRFSRIDLAGPALTFRRARDGHYYVGGIPLNPANPSSDFSDWIFKQDKVHISRATLAWRDELHDAPPLILRELDFRLENHFSRHRIQVRATPPRHVSTPLAFQADLKGKSVSDLRTWSGVVHGSVLGLSLPQLAQWIALPYPVSQGWGSATMRIDIDKGVLNRVSAGLNVRDVSASLDATLPPLQLAHLRGSLDWKRSESTQAIKVQASTLRLPGSRAASAFSAGYAWGKTERAANAKNLDLTLLQSVLPALPVPPSVRANLSDLQPRGRVDALELRWQGASPNASQFDLATRFSGVHLAASGKRPGVANVSGSVRGDEKSGVFELRGKSMHVDLPAIFRQSKVSLDSLQTKGSWKKNTQGYLVTLSQLNFANADAAGSGQGTFQSVNGRAGKVDITARLSRGNGTAVHRYLPKKIGDHTVSWVQRAVVAGTSNDTRLTLRGDLDRFPFPNDQGGVFKVVVGVQGAVLDYAEGWPRIEDANGELIFHGHRMEVRASQGRIFNARLGPVTAVIPNLHLQHKTLEINGKAVGDVQDFIRYANFSPVGERLNGVTDKMDGSGPMQLALNLKIPLKQSNNTTLAGRLRFDGDMLASPVLPRLEQIKGEIAFTQNTLTSQGLSAQFLGGSINIAAATRDGRVLIQAQGRATSQGLTPLLGKNWGNRLAGDAAWRGQIVLAQQNTQVRIASDLVGMESRLPAPLNKPASQPLRLVVTQLPLAGREQLTEIQLDRTLGAIWQTTADKRISRGEIHFGGVAKMPDEPGLRLAGSGRGLALTEWIRLLPEDNNEADNLPISMIDLSFGTLDLMGRRFPDVRVQGRNRGGLLRLAVSGRDMSGTLSYRAADKTARASSARISAQFKQLTIPSAEPIVGVKTDATETTHVNMKARDVPELELIVEDFRLENQAMGRLQASAHGTPQGLVIDKLQLSHADSYVQMSGLWNDVGTGETQATLQVDILDAGKMLSRYGYKDAVKRGNVNVEGDVTWEGSPVDFAFKSLAGTLNLKAKNGHFLKVEPGAAKLLGVLSLQSLPRRLMFDFRDIFSHGFAFDEISATMRIARGVVYSDDLYMKGPAAKVTMSGLAKLSDETVQLRVRVSPKLSEGVAVAGALIGGPIAGLGVLAAQKLLRDPFEAAGSREYMVTGPWDGPDVTRLTKTKKIDATKDSDG